MKIYFAINYLNMTNVFFIGEHIFQYIRVCSKHWFRYRNCFNVFLSICIITLNIILEKDTILVIIILLVTLCIYEWLIYSCFEKYLCFQASNVISLTSFSNIIDSPSYTIIFQLCKLLLLFSKANMCYIFNAIIS